MAIALVARVKVLCEMDISERRFPQDARIDLKIGGSEVDIRVDNGVIRNDRPLCKATRERSGQLRGRLGGGGAPIKLRTSNGSISLR